MHFLVNLNEKFYLKWTFNISSSTSMDVFTIHHIVITVFNIIGDESQFTIAIFSVSITFTDACQRTFFLLHIYRVVVGDLIEPIP
jgi:hypothetical protein